MPCWPAVMPPFSRGISPQPARDYDLAGMSACGPAGSLTAGLERGHSVASTARIQGDDQKGRRSLELLGPSNFGALAALLRRQNERKWCPLWRGVRGDRPARKGQAYRWVGRPPYTREPPWNEHSH